LVNGAHRRWLRERMIAVVRCAAFAASCVGAIAAAQVDDEAIAGDGAPWESRICSVAELDTCRELCQRRNWEACNNVGVFFERRAEPGWERPAGDQYDLACRFGSRGACANERRVAERAHRGAVASAQFER
jgi:hypothetical protein